MKKRMLAIVLTLVMCVTALAACTSDPPQAPSSVTQVPSQSSAPSQSPGSAEPAPASTVPDYLNETGFPIVKKPIEVTVFGSHSTSHADWNEMVLLKEYAEMTGVNVKYNTIVASEYAEQLNIVMASGVIPDGFMRAKLDATSQVRYGLQGLLAPINNYMDQYGPSFVEAISAPGVRENITAPDGNIYSLPQIFSGAGARYDNQKMWINKEWLDAVGMDIPTTADEYYAVLKAFREKDANGNGKDDEIGWSGDDSMKIIKFMMGSWGLYNRGFTKTDFGSGVEYDIDPATNELRIVFLDPRMKEVLAYCNKLYQEGLIDQEVFTIKSQSASLPAKALDNVLGSGFIKANTDFGIDQADKYVCMPALKGPYGDQIFTHVNAQAAIGMGGIGGKTQYPEAMMRWFDYFYSVEGATFIKMGHEGETYKKLPGGNYEQTEAVKKQEIKMTDWTPASSGQFPYSMFDILDDFRPDYVEAMNMLEPYTPEEVWGPFMFTEEEQNILNSVQSDINKYRKEMESKFVSGDEPIENFDKYLEQMKKMGSDQLLEIYNSAYQRMLSQ